MTDEELMAIRARVDAATPGPWARRDPFYGDGIVDGRNDDVISNNILRAEAAYDEATVRCRDADMVFIVAARTDVDALLNEVYRLKAMMSAMARGFGQHD